MDMAILTIVIFWHILFIIGMGLATAFLIFTKVASYNEDGSTDIDIDDAFKLLFFGLMMGSVLYLSGLAVSVQDDTIIKMVGFSAYEDTDDDTTKTIAETASGGTTTTTTTIETYKETKKDFFGLYDMQNNWGRIFKLQRQLQMGLPFLYIGILEVADVLVFTLLLLFYGSDS